jgi:cell division protein FtsZ
MENETLNFEFAQEQRSIIKVIGVGGGGSNAVNHMYRQGIQGVEFIICNTDYQDLQKSPVPHKIQLVHFLKKEENRQLKPLMKFVVN